ncbi:hypothetical protein [Halostagnicola sp. A-GB9-2]|uniref:hypothetical protein n=1 Tax=Halostagnicola sp. A-GB9-2 TaxID=3048066 RepID=UPI0024C00B76|nr:hypothetical protein [Halostagnicola sp. A-GB9-2]MDJ1431920.1 hypothetical protein [Halostagnicola sp. A-GB9-2]
MTDRSGVENAATRAIDSSFRRLIIDGIERRITSLSWIARASGVGLCFGSIGFVLLFVSVIERGGELTLITRPVPMRIALALPSLLVVFTLSTAVGALLAWRYRYWSLRARVHQTFLAALGVGFVWQLYSLGFIAA